MSLRETNNMTLSTANLFVKSKENMNSMSPLSMRMIDPMKILSSLQPNFNRNSPTDNNNDRDETNHNLLNFSFLNSALNKNLENNPSARTSPSSCTKKTEFANVFPMNNELDLIDHSKSPQSGNNNSQYNKINSFTTPQSQSKGDDDFCSLCQKHFCNKYYLRKHKQDVHGIQSEPFSITRRRESTGNVPQNFKKSQHSDDSEGHYENAERNDTLNMLKQSSLSLIPNFASILANMNANNNPSDNNNLSNLSEILQKTKQSDKNDLHNLLISCNGGNNSLTGNSLDSFKSSMAAAKLADRVTCELCNKELCNKYFLRTHKFKVHGISQGTCANNMNENINSLSSSMSTNSQSKLFNNNNNNTQQQEQPVKEDVPQKETLQTDSVGEHKENSTLDGDQRTDRMLTNPQEFLKSFIEENDKKFGKTICPLCGINVGIKFLLPGHLCQAHSLSINDPMFILCTLKANLGQEQIFDDREETRESPNSNNNNSCDIDEHESGNFIRPNSSSEGKNDASPPMQHDNNNGALYQNQWSQALKMNLLNQTQMTQSGGNNSPPLSSLPNQSPLNTSGSSVSHMLSKSPNQMRVLCDICNKWICNKYFLRTHKANKHGIFDGMTKPLKKKSSHSQGQQSSNSGSDLSPFDLMNRNNSIGQQPQQQSSQNIQNLLNPFLNGNGFPSNLETFVQQNILLNQNLCNNNNNTNAFIPNRNEGKMNKDFNFNFDPIKISKILSENGQKPMKSTENFHIPLNLSLKELLPLATNKDSYSKIANIRLRRRKRRRAHHLSTILQSATLQRASRLVKRSCRVLLKSNPHREKSHLRQQRHNKSDALLTRKIMTERNSDFVERSALATKTTTQDVDEELKQKNFQIPCIMCPNSKENYNLSTLIEHFYTIHSKPPTDLSIESLKNLFPNILNGLNKHGKSDNLLSSTSSSSSSSGLEFESTNQTAQQQQQSNLPLFNPLLISMAGLAIPQPLKCKSDDS